MSLTFDLENINDFAKISCYFVESNHAWFEIYLQRTPLAPAVNLEHTKKYKNAIFVFSDNLTIPKNMPRLFRSNLIAAATLLGGARGEVALVGAPREVLRHALEHATQVGELLGPSLRRLRDGLARVGMRVRGRGRGRFR